jgi:two-component system NtrC family response regulator
MLLDEIGEMSLDMQSKLLRVLQDGVVRRVGGTDTVQVDVRIISATNRNLRELVDSGRFREDLFYRISTVTVTLPPLRERRQDIPLLVNHFLEKVCKSQSIPLKEVERDVHKALTDFDWPGNIRELENEITRLVTLADDRVAMDNLSAKFRETVERKESLMPVALEDRPLKKVMEEIEKNILRKALEENRWNKTKTAKQLGLSRVALHKKLGKYELKGS